jgi:hypothetical protein
MAEQTRSRGLRTRVDSRSLELALGRLVGHPTDVILKAFLNRHAGSPAEGDPEPTLRALEAIDPFLAREVRALTELLAAAAQPGESEEREHNVVRKSTTE